VIIAKEQARCRTATVVKILVLVDYVRPQVVMKVAMAKDNALTVREKGIFYT
jgi:hypothetical protein